MASVRRRTATSGSISGPRSPTDKQASAGFVRTHLRAAWPDRDPTDRAQRQAVHRRHDEAEIVAEPKVRDDLGKRHPRGRHGEGHCRRRFYLLVPAAEMILNPCLSWARRSRFGSPVIRASRAVDLDRHRMSPASGSRATARSFARRHPRRPDRTSRLACRGVARRPRHGEASAAGGRVAGGSLRRSRMRHLRRSAARGRTHAGCRPRARSPSSSSRGLRSECRRCRFRSQRSC